MKTIYLLCLSSFILLGCQNTPPRWVLKPPQDVTYLYGVGEASTREIATQTALADIASKIYITVQSQINSNITATQQDDKETVRSYARKTINTQVSPIKINDYTIDKVFLPSPTKAYILLKVERRKLINNYKILLDNQLTAYQGWRIKSGQASQFMRYKFLKPAYDSLAEFKRNYLIVSSLDADINIRKYINYGRMIADEFVALTARFKFIVIAEDTDSQSFAIAIRHNLAKQQLLTDKKSIFKLKISTDKAISEIFNARYKAFKETKYVVTLVLLENNEIINSHKIKFTAMVAIDQYTPTVTHQDIKQFIEKLPSIL